MGYTTQVSSTAPNNEACRFSAYKMTSLFAVDTCFFELFSPDIKLAPLWKYGRALISGNLAAARDACS